MWHRNKEVGGCYSGKLWGFSFEGQMRSLEKRREKVRELWGHGKYYTHQELG